MVKSRFPSQRSHRPGTPRKIIYSVPAYRRQARNGRHCLEGLNGSFLCKDISANGSTIFTRLFTHPAMFMVVLFALFCTCFTGLITFVNCIHLQFRIIFTFGGTLLTCFCTINAGIVALLHAGHVFAGISTLPALVFTGIAGIYAIFHFLRCCFHNFVLLKSQKMVPMILGWLIPQHDIIRDID